MTISRFFAKAKQNKNDKFDKSPTPDKSKLYRILLGVGTILIISILFSMHLVPDSISLQVGDISPRDIRAHRSVKYLDTQLTEELRQKAIAHTDKKYKDIPNASSYAAANAANIFDLLKQVRSDNTLSSSEKNDYIVSNIKFDLSKETISALIVADHNTFIQIQSYVNQTIKDIMSRSITDDTNDAQIYRQEFKRRMINYLGNGRYANAASEIGERIIHPNRIFDSEATEKERRRSSDAVLPQYKQIASGELIINRNEQVTASHMDKFTALGLKHPVPDYVAILSIILLVILVFVIIVAYIIKFHPNIYASNKLLLLLCLIVTISLFALKLGGSMLKLQLSGIEYNYFAMIWIASAGMLIAALINPQIAVLIISVITAASGLAMGHDLQWSLGAFLSSLVAIYVVSNLKNKLDYLPATITLIIANLVIVLITARVNGDAMPDIIIGSVWAVVGGIASIMLFWFGSLAIEKPFGIVTHNSLVDLSDTNHPILKRLLMEAPGTYSHSIYVGHIASTAADLIGADPLLVRVASYYHDIGKIRRPNFFVENQHVENIHNRLNPSLSAIVIRSHIKDGLDLAAEYRLPMIIRELMSQHHGTSLVRYFYYQAAVGASGGTAMLEQQFRYDGDKPRSKESALLMLADSCEAASRSLAKPTLGQISDMVSGIISDKLSDGQLDDAELTFRDIKTIKESFIRTLSSMMHARIEYPDLSALEGKKAGATGNTDKEQTSNGS